MRTVRLIDKYSSATLYVHEFEPCPEDMASAYPKAKPVKEFAGWWWRACRVRGYSHPGTPGIVYRLVNKAGATYHVHTLKEMVNFFFRNFSEDIEKTEEPFLLFWTLHSRIEKQMKELGSWPGD